MAVQLQSILLHQRCFFGTGVQFSRNAPNAIDGLRPLQSHACLLAQTETLSSLVQCHKRQEAGLERSSLADTYL